jgi:hypothetical protein
MMPTCGLSEGKKMAGNTSAAACAWMKMSSFSSALPIQTAGRGLSRRLHEPGGLM